MAQDSTPCPSCGGSLEPDNVCLACMLNEALEADDAQLGEGPGSSESSFGDYAAPTAGVFGKYILREKLGEGGMGVIWEAEDTTLRRVVALKMMRGFAFSSDREKERFRIETNAVAQLDHPNIVPIYEVGVQDDQHYFTMKLIKGGTLRDQLELLQNDPTAAAEMMSTAAGAVHAAHQRGILHRDLKPENILIDEAGEPHVTDFGLAKQMESISPVTLSGQIMGTPQFMPPEQAQGGSDQLTMAADVYGLGAVFYRVICGRPPHVGKSVMDTLRLAAEEEAAPPSKYRPEVDRDLETITMKCLERDPLKRYDTAQELKHDLDRWLRGEPIEARVVGVAEKTLKWMRRKPVHAAALGLAALFLLTLGIGGPIVALQQSKLRKDAELATDAEATARKLESEARQRADIAANLAEERSAELRKTLYANEMHLALVSEGQGGAATAIKKLLDHWRPKEGEEDLRGWEWYYLRSRLEQAELVLDHPAEVWTAVWSRDDKLVFTGCEDGAIRIWDTESGRLVNTLQGDGQGIMAVSASPDGDRLASVDRPGNLKIRSLESGKVLVQGKVYIGHRQSLAWNSDGTRLVVGSETIIRVYDALSGDVVAHIRTDRSSDSIALHPDGKRIVAAAGDNLIVWDHTSDEKVVIARPAGLTILYDVDWDAEGEAVIISAPSNLHRADPVTGTVTKQYALNPDDYATQSEFTPSHDRVAYTNFEGEIRLMDTATGATSRALPGHMALVHELRWSRRGDRLLSSSSDGSARIWKKDRLDGKQLPNSPYNLSWRPGSTEIAAGSWNRFTLLNLPFDKKTRDFNVGDLEGEVRIAWSTDGKKAAIISPARVDIARPVPETRELKTELHWEVPYNMFHRVGWEPHGHRLIIGGRKSVHVFSTTDGRLLREWNGLSDRQWRRGAWHPDGKRLLIEDGLRLSVTNLDTGEVEEEWETEEMVSAVAWEPGGEILATAREKDALVELWEMPGARKIGEIKGASLKIHSLAWSRDGSLLAMGGEDRVVRLWSRELERFVLTFPENNGRIEELAWDDSGARLAVTMKGQPLVILDATEGYLAEGSPQALPLLDQRILAEPDRKLHRFQRAGLLEKLGRREEAAAAWESLGDGVVGKEK